MKTYFLLASLAVTSMAQAQNKTPFYVKADAGYALSLAGQAMMTDVTTTGSSSTFKVKQGNTIGDGFKATIAVGYMFSPSFGLEAGTLFSASPTHKGKTVWQSSLYEQTSTSELKDRSGLVYLNAKYVMSTSGKFQPYLRLGVIANAWGKATGEDGLVAQNLTPPKPAPYTESSKAELSYRMSFGMSGAIGCNYKLSERLSLYGELSAVGLNKSGKKSVVTEKKINGVDITSMLTTRDKETEFVKEYTDSNDTSKPRKQESMFMPASYVGLSIGVQFSI